MEKFGQNNNNNDNNCTNLYKLQNYLKMGKNLLNCKVLGLKTFKYYFDLIFSIIYFIFDSSLAENDLITNQKHKSEKKRK